jgi:hypothetical protein
VLYPVLEKKAMNANSTPDSGRPDPESATSTGEVHQLNGLFMLVNATFLLIAWCCLNALA